MTDPVAARAADATTPMWLRRALLTVCGLALGLVLGWASAGEAAAEDAVRESTRGLAPRADVTQSETRQLAGQVTRGLSESPLVEHITAPTRARSSASEPSTGSEPTAETTTDRATHEHASTPVGDDAGRVHPEVRKGAAKPRSAKASADQVAEQSLQLAVEVSAPQLQVRSEAIVAATVDLSSPTPIQLTSRESPAAQVLGTALGPLLESTALIAEEVVRPTPLGDVLTAVTSPASPLLDTVWETPAVADAVDLVKEAPSPATGGLALTGDAAEVTAVGVKAAAVPTYVTVIDNVHHAAAWVTTGQACQDRVITMIVGATDALAAPPAGSGDGIPLPSPLAPLGCTLGTTTLSPGGSVHDSGPAAGPQLRVLPADSLLHNVRTRTNWSWTNAVLDIAVSPG